MQVISFFDEIRLTDADAVGGKGANLGELTQAGFPVPPGFVVRAEAYLAAIDAAGVRERARCAPVRCRRLGTTPRSRRRARRPAAVLSARRRCPTEIADAIRAAPTAKLGDDVRGRRALVGDERGLRRHVLRRHERDVHQRRRRRRACSARIVDCWASLYGERAIAYRAARGIDDEPTIAVVVQTMIAVRAVRASCSPPTRPPAIPGPPRHRGDPRPGRGDRERHGRARHLRRRQGPRCTCSSVRVGPAGPQDRARRRRRRPARSTSTPNGRRARCSTTSEILELARLAHRRREALRHARRTSSGRWPTATTWLVQSRPITTLHAARAGRAADRAVLLRGLAASPGRASRRGPGPAQPGRGRPAADRRGPGRADDQPRLGAGHAPRRRAGHRRRRHDLPRRDRLPRARRALRRRHPRRRPTTLHDGEIVTVDGRRGEVLDGAVPRQPAAGQPRPRHRRRRPRCRDDADRDPALRQPRRRRARRARSPRSTSTASACSAPSSWSPTRSTACTRGCCMRAGRAAAVRRRDDASRCCAITRAFAPRPVVYRSIDFRSNEFRGLEGGDRFEPHEENPMIGYRGCFRYVDQPDLFHLELDVLGAVAAADPEPAADDPVRAHRVGAGALPGHRRAPTRPRPACRSG